MRPLKCKTNDRVKVWVPGSEYHEMTGVVTGYNEISHCFTVKLDERATTVYLRQHELVEYTKPADPAPRYPSVKDELTALHAKYLDKRNTAQEDLEKYEKTLADIESVLVLITSSE